MAKQIGLYKKYTSTTTVIH